MERQTITRDDVIELVKRLPREKLAEVYDFITFVQSRTTTVAGEDEVNDWLNDSEETMAAEDALWQQVGAPSFVPESQAAYSPLRDAALAEIEAGTTQPMFDEVGEFITGEGGA